MAEALILHQVGLLRVPHSSKAVSNKQFLRKSGAYLGVTMLHIMVML